MLASTALMTPPVERAFHRFHQLRGTVVLTNVPGPSEPLALCGAQVQGMFGWGGKTRHLNLSWALCSVDGRVFSGARPSRVCVHGATAGSVPASELNEGVDRGGPRCSSTRPG